jgi:hypothetical protein
MALDPDLHRHQKIRGDMSNLEDKFLNRLLAAGLPAPLREHHFALEIMGSKSAIYRAGLKDWRFDFAWPGRRVAVEIEGGTWTKGRHVQPRGYAADCDKYNHATLFGWRVYRFTTDMVSSGRAIATMRLVFGVSNE